MSLSAPVKGTKAVLVLGRSRRTLCCGRKTSFEAVGPGHVGDAGEPEFLGQALLQGAEHARREPPCLGRVGRDQLDAELARALEATWVGVSLSTLPPASWSDIP